MSMRNLNNKLNSLKNIVIGTSSKYYNDNLWFITDELEVLPIELILEDVEIREVYDKEDNTRDTYDTHTYTYNCSMIGHYDQIENVCNFFNKQSDIERKNARILDVGYSVEYKYQR